MTNFVKVTREMEVAKGDRPGWWLVKMGDKKWIMKEVPSFFGEKEENVAETFGK
jgi:hypothetical protein